MKYITILILSIVTLSLFSSGCSESSMAKMTDSRDVAMCENNGSTQIKEGDDLISKEEGTRVKILHLEDNSKTVCVVEGAAYLQ